VQFDVQTVALGAISVESSPHHRPIQPPRATLHCDTEFFGRREGEVGWCAQLDSNQRLQLRRLKTGGSLSSQLKENRTGDLLKSPQKISRKSLKNREAIRAN